LTWHGTMRRTPRPVPRAATPAALRKARRETRSAGLYVIRLLLVLLVRWERISTPPSREALYLTAFAPLLEDTLHLCVGLIEGLFGRQLAGGGLAHQLSDEPAVEDLSDRCIRVTRIADIGGPAPGVR